MEPVSLDPPIFSFSSITRSVLTSGPTTTSSIPDFNSGFLYNPLSPLTDYDYDTDSPSHSALSLPPLLPLLQNPPSTSPMHIISTAFDPLLDKNTKVSYRGQGKKRYDCTQVQRRFALQATPENSITDFRTHVSICLNLFYSLLILFLVAESAI